MSRPSPDAAVWSAPSPCASRLPAQGHPTAQPLLAPHDRSQGPPCGSGSKSVCLQCWRPGLDPRVGKSPWRRQWQPTPVFFLPGKSHGQRSLVGYSPWGHKGRTRQSDFTFPFFHRGQGDGSTRPSSLLSVKCGSPPEARGWRYQKVELAHP